MNRRRRPAPAEDPPAASHETLRKDMAASKKALHYRAQQLGVFIKPLPTMFFRCMAEYFTAHPKHIRWKRNLNEKKKYKNTRGVRGTERGREKWNKPHFREIFLQLPGACSRNKDKEDISSAAVTEFTRHLIMMKNSNGGLPQGLSGAVALKYEPGQSKPTVVGCVLWQKFEPGTNARDSQNANEEAYEQISYHTYEFEDAAVQSDIESNAVAHLSTICTHVNEQRSGIGSLMTWYGLYDIERRLSRGSRKFRSVILDTVPHQTEFDSYDNYRQVMRTSMPAVMYEKVGFRELKERKRDPDQEVAGLIGEGEGNAYDTFFMCYRIEDEDVYNLSHRMENQFQMRPLETICQAPGVCL